MTAGIYFQLNYSFLGAVQLLIYAGGITVLYVFSILLTSSQGDKAEDLKGYKLFAGLAATLASLGICLWVMLRHDFNPSHFEHGELHVQTIGHALMSPESTATYCLSRSSASCCWPASSAESSSHANAKRVRL